MSRYPRFKRLRTSWRPQWPAVGCLITATDGTWGLGMTRYGGPVIAIINEHLGPLLVGESCTAELIKDQPGTLALSLGLPIPVVPLELPAYSRKENWGAAETLYHLTRAMLKQAGAAPAGATVVEKAVRSGRPRANLLGEQAERGVWRALHEDRLLDLHPFASSASAKRLNAASAWSQPRLRRSR